MQNINFVGELRDIDDTVSAMLISHSNLAYTGTYRCHRFLIDRLFTLLHQIKLAAGLTPRIFRETLQLNQRIS